MEKTRQLFFGNANLATGFRLAGFETFPDAGIEELEQSLEKLQLSRAHAFVVIDQQLAGADSQLLEQVRREGGCILLTQVPPLTHPEQMKSSVDDHIQQLLGANGEKA